MKFYIHCKEPELTMVIKWEGNSDDRIGHLKQIFYNNFKQKFGGSHFEIKDKDSIEIYQGNKIYGDEDIVVKKVKHMSDVYVRWRKTEPTVRAEETNIPADSSDESKHEEKSDILGATASVSEQSIKIDEVFKVADTLYEKSHIRKAILVYEDILRVDKHNLRSYIGIIDAYLKARRPRKALDYVQKAQRHHSGNKELMLKEGQCYLDLGDADNALEILLQYCKDMRKSGGVDTAHKHDTQVMLAKAYQLKGQNDMAITILQGVLRENREHLDALVEYAVLLFPLGPSQKEDAMAIMLTALASKRNDKYIQDKFASICKHQHGLKVLKSVSDSAWDDVASVVYMATTLRDCGAIDEAMELMEHAYKLQPDNAHTLLTYVHTMELIEKHSEGVGLIKEFVKQFPHQCSGNFRCDMLQPILSRIHGDIYLSSDEVASELSAPDLLQYGETYTEYELYLLALIFTLVKLLYVKGALHYIPYLTKILDPCCEGHDLHQTNIRNEAAYYTCISQIFKVHKEIPKIFKDTPFIYFIGDSHCISPAWQPIRIQNETKIIHPILTTGTKIWHLREDSTFYPKTDFQSSISNIPDNATVITCFGEIDCREALLLCVEKGKYDSTEEVIDAVIDIYVGLLLQLKRQRHWTIYVHPVMPILDITRPLVLQFNRHLSQRLLKQAQLVWLDFADELLIYEDEIVHLRPEYDNNTEKKPGEKSPNILRGDITRKDEAKMLREKNIAERQIKRTAAAEEMSGKIMEDRELLSLGTRSRATSRATSRAGSPSVTTRKQVTFKSDLDAGDSPNSSSSKIDKISKNGKSKQSNKVAPNGNVKTSENNNHNSKASVLMFEPINIEITDSVNQSKTSNHDSSSTVVENNQSDSDIQQKNLEGSKVDKLSVIDERTSSRCSGKSESETKRG